MASVSRSSASTSEGERGQGARLEEDELGADDDEVGHGAQVDLVGGAQGGEVLVCDLDERDGGDVQVFGLNEVEEQVQRTFEDRRFDGEHGHGIIYPLIKRRHLGQHTGLCSEGQQG